MACEALVHKSHRRGRRLRPGIGALACSVIALATAIAAPPPAGGAAAPARLLGPVLSPVENANTTLTRDGGFSAALPNGRDFFVFADTPRYDFRRNAWRITSFITGSTAGMVPFTRGKPLRSALTEVRPGAALRRTNQPTRFLATPRAYLPDGSGKRCSSASGGSRAFSARWPTGAALMPDKANVLVPYAIMCVFNAQSYFAEGWGFALFNYRKQTFSVRPTDVIRAPRSGAELPHTEMYGAPIVVGHNVTFYSWECCDGPNTGVYATTVGANAAALKRRASYVPKRLPSLPKTYNVYVGRRSKGHPQFTMYVLTDKRGEYSIYTAASPTGPWSQVDSGALPHCGKRPDSCNSMALHPELSPPGRLVVSYHLANYGPAVASKHRYPHDPLRHVVTASIPCTC